MLRGLSDSNSGILNDVIITDCVPKLEEYCGR